MKIGEKLKSLRLRMRKTLKEESEVLGVSLNSVYRWEHDLALPRKSMLKNIADYYKVDLEWLLQEDAAEENAEHAGEVFPFEYGPEQQLLKIFRKLSPNDQYKVLGYIERIYVEDFDKQQKKNAHTLSHEG